MSGLPRHDTLLQLAGEVAERNPVAAHAIGGYDR
jgi:hypothetical protein